jgi:hypothetical protein
VRVCDRIFDADSQRRPEPFQLDAGLAQQALDRRGRDRHVARNAHPVGESHQFMDRVHRQVCEAKRLLFAVGFDDKTAQFPDVPPDRRRFAMQQLRECILQHIGPFCWHQPPTSANLARCVLDQHVVRAERVVPVDFHACDGGNVPPETTVKDPGSQAVHLVDVSVVKVLTQTNPDSCLHVVLPYALAQPNTHGNLCILDRKTTYQPG